jgi:hypothetical protein
MKSDPRIKRILLLSCFEGWSDASLKAKSAHHFKHVTQRTKRRREGELSGFRACLSVHDERPTTGNGRIFPATFFTVLKQPTSLASQTNNAMRDLRAAADAHDGKTFSLTDGSTVGEVDGLVLCAGRVVRSGAAGRSFKLLEFQTGPTNSSPPQKKRRPAERR